MLLRTLALLIIFNITSRDKNNFGSLSFNYQYFRPKRFGLKSYKRLYFVCKNLYLLAYKSGDAARKGGELQFSVHLKGCEVTPALNLTANKYEIKLEVPSAEGMTEMFLKFISVS